MELTPYTLLIKSEFIRVCKLETNAADMMTPLGHNKLNGFIKVIFS